MTDTEELRTSDDERRLLEFIARRDCPCPVCRYNLRDLTRPMCPECGSELQLQVGALNPRFGLLLLAMSPLIIMAGISAFVVVVGLLRGFPPGRGLYIILSTGAVDFAVCILAYSKRHVFLRRSQGVQISIILLAWVFQVLVLFVTSKYGR